MKIIDFHTHIGYNTTKKYGYDMTADLFENELRRSGICMAAGSAIDMELINSGENYGDVIKKLNLIAWNYAQSRPGFFVPGIHIHPRFVEESAKELECYSRKGVKLVGELVPYLMGCRLEDNIYTSKDFMELWDLCAQFSLTVSVHTGTAEECLRIARTFKGLNLVMAHPSYGNEYMARLDAVRSYDNLYLDLSGTGIAAYGMLRYGVDTVGREKLIFGTDFPIYNPEIYVKSVLYEKLTDDEREYIFYKNAGRLLGLD